MVPFQSLLSYLERARAGRIIVHFIDSVFLAETKPSVRILSGLANTIQFFQSFFLNDFVQMVYWSRRLLTFPDSLSVAKRKACFEIQAARKIQRAVWKALLNVVPVFLSFGRNYLFRLLDLSNAQLTIP